MILSPESLRKTVSLLGFQRHADAVVDAAGWHAEGEIAPCVPICACQLTRCRPGRRLVPTERDRSRLTAGLVSPGEADQQRGIQYLIAINEVFDAGVDALARLDQGHGAFAREQQWNANEGFCRAAVLAQAAHEQRNGALAGCGRVFVGGGAVGGEEIELIHDGGGKIAVQVVTGADGAVGSDDCANRADVIGFGVIDALDRHGAVHIKIDAIPGCGGPQAVDELAFERIVDRALQDSAGHGAGLHERNEVDISVLSGEGVTRVQFVSAQHDEI